MAISGKQIALLRIAKAQLGLGDEAYRDILKTVAGVESSTELNNDSFDWVMRRFVELGFIPRRKAAWYGERAAMASPGQIALIQRLWADYTKGEGTETTLGKWLDNKFKVSALRFLGAGAAPKVITALRAMTTRQ